MDFTNSNEKDKKSETLRLKRESFENRLKRSTIDVSAKSEKKKDFSKEELL